MLKPSVRVSKKHILPHAIPKVLTIDRSHTMPKVSWFLAITMLLPSLEENLDFCSGLNFLYALKGYNTQFCRLIKDLDRTAGQSCITTLPNCETGRWMRHMPLPMSERCAKTRSPFGFDNRGVATSKLLHEFTPSGGHF